MPSRDRRSFPAVSLFVALSITIGGFTSIAPAFAQSGAETEPPIAPAAAAAPSESVVADMKEATSQMVQGAYADAETTFRRILITQPDNVEALAGLGMALGRQYKLDEAEQQFARVLSLQPNHAVAHCGRAMVLLYRVDRNELGNLTRAQALKEAGRECNKALDSDARVVEAHYLLGTVFKEEGRTDLAIQAFSGAIKLDPHYVRAYNMLAATQVQKGKLTEAIENYKQAISIQPRGVTAHLGLAEIYRKQSRWQDAVSELNKVIAINPKNVAAHLALAQAFQSRGDLPSALHEYEELKALKPDDAQAYIEIAKLSDRQGDMDRALTEYQNALTALPKSTPIRLRYAWQAFTMGRPDDATREFSAVLAADPSNVEAAAGLAQAFYVKTLRMSAPTVAATAEFHKNAQLISQEYKKQPANQTLQLADGIMQSIAGNEVTPIELNAASPLMLKLLNAQVLLGQRQFVNASAALASAINSSTTPEEAAQAADTAFAVRDLDVAESGYRRLGIFVGFQLRAQQGLLLVNSARNQAIADLNGANLALATKQYKPAIEKFRSAVWNNPRLAAAQVGLAESLEKDAPSAENPLTSIKEALYRYQIYMAMSPGLAPKEQDRVQKRINKLQGAIVHAQQNPNGGIRGLLERLSVR